MEVVDGVHDVKHSPSDNDNVVNIFQKDHHDSRVSNALKDWTNLADNVHSTNPEILANRDLQ